MSLQPRKACPRCQSAAPLTAAQCLACGHQYRTLFVSSQMVPAVNRTQKFYAFVTATSEAKTVQVALSLCLAVLAISAVRFGMQIATQTAPMRSHSFHRIDPMRKNVSIHVARNRTPITSDESAPSNN